LWEKGNAPLAFARAFGDASPSPSLLALAKPQNNASVPHRSFARKMLRFFKALDLERENLKFCASGGMSAT
jgi:hypothetical protein